MGSGSAEKSRRTSLKVAYLTGVFPATSQTFVMREIRALKDYGIEIKGFAARRSGDTEVEEELLEADQEWIFARPDNLWPHLLSNLKNLVLHPRRYLATLGFFLRQAARMEPPAFARLLYHFFCGIGFSERMRREGIRHMHCHFSTGANMALAAHLFSGIPFSFTAHASGDIFVRPILIEEKVKHAEYVVAVCDYSRRYLDSITGYRYSPKIHRIYNGIDAAEPERLLTRKGGEVQRREEQNGKYQVISVGRLIGCKGFGTLLEALRILKGRGRRINCAIIGTGPEKKRLEELIQQWDLGDTVTLTGAFPLHRVYEILKESYLFVLLSEVHEDGTRDSFPTVILEAMAMSLPVIATSISGIPEMVVHGRTGLLVPERDADAAAAALERLIVDEALRLQMGEAGRLRALEMFGGHSQVSALAALMKGAMRAGQGGK